MADEIIELTPFGRELLKRQKCPFCQSSYRIQDATGHGNRRGRDGRSYYYYETLCSQCNNPSLTIVTSRPMNTKGLMEAFIEMYQEGPSSPAVDDQQVGQPDGGGEEGGVLSDSEEPKQPEETPQSPQPKPVAKSKISDAEVSEAKKIIDASDTHAQMLGGFGITKEQIEQWQRQYEEKDGNGNQGK